MVITDDNRLFIVGQRQVFSEYHPYLYLLDFSDTSIVTCHTSIELSTFNYGHEAINMNRYTFMSISINERSQKVLVGIPSLDMIVFLTYNVTNYVMISSYHVLNKTGTGYGKSVALLDNHTYAVLAYELPTLPWSTSQIQVYSLDNIPENDRPLYVYPNNQQIIPVINSKPASPTILTLVSWQKHIGLVLDVGIALILPASPPG
ncbi:unnamed protein product, partial [Rotaria sp. Silwood1]